MAKTKELQEVNGIPVKIEPSDFKYKFIAYLNNKFLVKEQRDITKNDYKNFMKNRENDTFWWSVWTFRHKRIRKKNY